MTISAGNFRGGHLAVAKLLDNARRCAIVTVYTGIRAGCQHINRVSIRSPLPGVAKKKHGEPQA
jgi:hypothetical protein